MIPLKIIACTVITVLLCSCAQQKSNSSSIVQTEPNELATPVVKKERPEHYDFDPYFQFDPSKVYHPVSVDLRNMPSLKPGQYHPDSPENLRKRRLKEDSESIFSKSMRKRLLRQSHRLEFDPDIQIAPDGRAPDAKAPNSLTAFDSMDFTETNGYTPPDPELAAGPNHLIAVANSAMEIYDKTGTSLVGPMALTTLFTGTVCGNTSNFLAAFDPNVLYDEAYDRFIVAVDQKLGSTSNHYCVAVSQSADPTTLWYVYVFNTIAGGAWMDYPHAGVGDDAIYMGGNMFTSSFQGSRVWAFNKALMYAGLGTVAASQAMPVGLSTPQPINLHGFNHGTWPVGQPHYIMTSNGFTTTAITLLSWADPFDGTNGVLTNMGSLTLGAVGLPVSSQQSGAANFASYQDSRILDFEYRNGFGWTTHTTACNPGSGTVNCIRWAQVDLSSATLGPAGTGTYGSNGDYRIYPDLAVNHCNDMSIGYTHSSSTSFPSIRVTGRLNTDASGTLQAETSLINATVPYTASTTRWGDYTGMTIDPDGETFWYLGEYSKVTTGGNNWGLHIGSFNYSSCSPASLSLADAYIKDLPADVGIEPDPLAGNMWNSPSIWNSLDDLAAGGHQNPEFGQLNHMFVRLDNSGPNQPLTDITGRIHLYYAFASSGLSWDTDWTEFGVIPVANLTAGSFSDQSAPFDPPGTGHYCIVARWVSAQDPMSFVEGTSINTNTRNNNNIAWRNMNVVNDILLPEVSTNTAIVRNISSAFEAVHLGVLDFSETSFLQFGTIRLRLDDELLERWLGDGAQGEGVRFDEKTREIIVASPRAKLFNLPMKFREEFKVQILFYAEKPTGRRFHVSLTQFDLKEQPIGGVDYLIQPIKQRP